MLIQAAALKSWWYAYNGIAIIATSGKNNSAKTAIQLIGALGWGAVIASLTPRTLGGISEYKNHKWIMD
ncbi:hypothetical protein [Acinetobacter cumulans]|uniref:hypothetical protein n=1 Tax=Acinetobacter cumulans TaxID=2136182 RepID=UPI001D1808CB|nr:hypothetical protein [Acinetobacter cumulans]